MVRNRRRPDDTIKRALYIAAHDRPALLRGYASCGSSTAHDQVLAVLAGTTEKEVTRYKAYGHSNRAPA